MTKKIKSNQFYKTLLLIALPVALQNLITASLNMVDTMMIGRLGEEAIAAVGMANQLFFLFNLICFGICSGGAIFIAQYWGKKDIPNIRAVMGFILVAVSLCGAVFTVIALGFPGAVMMVFDAEPQVKQLGVTYLRIVGISYLATAFTFAYSISSRSVQKATMPMIVSGIALLLNAVLNYIFIFGKLGFPAMGVAGAALGTLIARIFELVVMVGAIYATNHPLAGTLKELRGFTRDFLRRYRFTALPVIINEFAWSTGMVMYSVAYARLGTEAMAAVQVYNVATNLFMVFSFGLANACGVMLGNKLGEGADQEAIEYSKRFLYLTFLVGAVIGIIIYLSIPWVLQIFAIKPNLQYTVRTMLIIKAVFLPILTFNAALIVGILRSGGDTRFALFLELFSVWGFGVPMAFLGAVVFRFPIHIVVFMTTLEEVVKALIGVPRLLSRKWVKNLI